MQQNLLEACQLPASNLRVMSWGGGLTYHDERVVILKLGILENSTIDGTGKFVKERYRINGAPVLGSSKTFETFFFRRAPGDSRDRSRDGGL